MAYRTPMSREERAKQFMPFAALKGYSEALEKKEKLILEKWIMNQEYQEELGIIRVLSEDIDLEDI